MRGRLGWLEDMILLLYWCRRIILSTLQDKTWRKGCSLWENWTIHIFTYTLDFSLSQYMSCLNQCNLPADKAFRNNEKEMLVTFGTYVVFHFLKPFWVLGRESQIGGQYNLDSWGTDFKYQSQGTLQMALFQMGLCAVHGWGMDVSSIGKIFWGHYIEWVESCSEKWAKEMLFLAVSLLAVHVNEHFIKPLYIRWEISLIQLVW